MADKPEPTEEPTEEHEHDEPAPGAVNLKRCPGCGAMIESEEVAHYDIHGDLESRIAALEARRERTLFNSTEGDEEPEEPKKKSRFDFTTYHWED